MTYRKVIGAVLVFSILAAIAYIFGQSHKPAISQSTLFNSSQIEIEAPTGAPIQGTVAKKIDVAPITEKRGVTTTIDSNLPSWKDLQNKYAYPEDDLPAYVADLLQKYDQDIDGSISMKLYKAFTYCNSAPKSINELESLKKTYEEASLLSGADNGQIQENIARADKQYSTCQQLEQIVPNFQLYDYIQNAATLGDASAKVGLATAIQAPNFDQLSESAKSEYRKKMGSLLEEARIACEPKAFQAFANAKAFGEGSLWVDPNPVPDEIRSYANLLAYGMYYHNKTKDGAAIVQQNNGILQTKAGSMSPEQISEAEAYGRYLFNSNCTSK